MDTAIFEREASEHIKNMDKGLDIDEEKQSCSIMHGDTARAIKWLIRQIESIMKFVCTIKGDKGHRILKLGWLEIPVERGFTFRDVIAFLGFLALVYLVLAKEGVV
jgi:hypothetical protein